MPDISDDERDLLNHWTSWTDKPGPGATYCGPFEWAVAPVGEGVIDLSVVSTDLNPEYVTLFAVGDWLLIPGDRDG